MASPSPAFASARRYVAKHVFMRDARVRSVGLGIVHGARSYIAIRNASIGKPLSGQWQPVDDVGGTPVRYIDAAADPVPFSTSERDLVRPLVAGLQVANLDQNQRTGIDQVGTLGCFVASDGWVGFLSNNHVIAGENRGAEGCDRIATESPRDGVTIGVLHSFVHLRPSPAGASPASEDVAYNVIDAALAKLHPELPWNTGYPPGLDLPTPGGGAVAQLGDQVFKVGRTTGLTRGVVTQILTTVGPVQYRCGPCWFEESIVVQGDGFASPGDSGSAVVLDDGKVIGLIYAGLGSATYVCPIAPILEGLNCRLA